MTGDKVHAVGSDLIHPWLDDVYEYIVQNLSKGTVVLYYKQ
jgi:hypothetical protein